MVEANHSLSQIQARITTASFVMTRSASRASTFGRGLYLFSCGKPNRACPHSLGAHGAHGAPLLMPMHESFHFLQGNGAIVVGIHCLEYALVRRLKFLQ